MISNYYYSTKFNFDPHFMYFFNFTMGGEFGTDVKVLVAGTYKFEIDLSTKKLTVYCDGEQLEEDRTPTIYIRGSIGGVDRWNNLGVDTLFAKSKVDNDTIATITIQLSVGDVFKIADASWGNEYAYSYFKEGTECFKEGTENGNIEVLKDGLYEISVNLSTNKVTVKKDGEEIFKDAVGGNGSTATGSYALIIIHADGTQTQVNLQPWENFNEYSQHFGDNVQLQAGDVVKLYDVVNNADWVEKNLDPYGEYQKFEVTDAGFRCKEAGTYDFYVKFKWEDNLVYIGPAN